MKKLTAALIVAVPLALFCRACYFVFSAPPEPPFDWRLHMTQAQHDLAVAPINHAYTRAAYTVTWAIQLAYVAWLYIRWQSQKRKLRP